MQRIVEEKGTTIRLGFNQDLPLPFPLRQAQGERQRDNGLFQKRSGIKGFLLVVRAASLVILSCLCYPKLGE
jgi:hypothetical protein